MSEVMQQNRRITPTTMTRDLYYRTFIFMGRFA